MKKLFILVALSGLLFSCGGPATEQTDNTGEQEAVQQDENKAYYGATIKGENIISGEEMIKMLEDKDSVYVTLKGTIVSNCQVSGCWMDLDLGTDDQLAKVTFKDYEFVIPIDSKGKTATVEGIAKREIIPVDLLQHYAEDEGKSAEEIAAITEDEVSITFEAVGVIIED